MKMSSKRKIKKLSALLLLLALLINLAFSLTSCDWRAERDRIFAEVDKIEKHSDYAIITDYEYITSTEKIAFKDLVKNRIVNDGRTIEASYGSFDRVGDFIVFSLRYKTEKRFWGINDSNNYWAVGVISLDDFSIEIYYLKNNCEEISPSFASYTHLCFDALDTDKESEKKEDYECIIIDRVFDKVTTIKGKQSTPPEIIGAPIKDYENPHKFVWNGEAFSVGRSTIRNEKGEIIAELDPYDVSSFTYSDILEISPELRKVNDILGEGKEDDIQAFFFTNGEELFVGFVTKTTMFGAECNLVVPVIFKTNLDFDSFEYIGCAKSSSLWNFYDKVQIKKIK